MLAEEIREFCLRKAGVSEGFPFGPDHLVFKVGGKMFLLMSLDESPLSLNLKQNPEKSIVLREQYFQISPGWHMNKTHWNTVICEGLPRRFIEELISDSYDLVLKSLPMKVRKEIESKN